MVVDKSENWPEESAKPQTIEALIGNIGRRSQAVKEMDRAEEVIRNKKGCSPRQQGI